MMKINNLLDLEQEYLSTQTRFLIEEQILYSFPKKELKNLIESLKNEYLKLRLPYIGSLNDRKKQEDYICGTELDKYFIEKFYFFFKGGEDIDKIKIFLDRLQRFYKSNYVKQNNKNFKIIDVDSIPIVEILGMYMTLPNNLRNNCKCPLHREKTGSFRIYETTNSWYCFGCKKGGNAVNFIAEIENIDKKQAFKKFVNLYTN